MNAELKLLKVAELVDHPHNPRLAFRDDVIDGIVAALDGEWPQQHALHVRPVGENFEVLSGHHRKRAAEKAGIAEVWCWVEEGLDDHDAFMALVLENTQGELTPLERGFHALRATEKGKWGKAYAESVGRLQQEVQREVQAAKVASKVTPRGVTFPPARWRHLAEAHALPEELWGAAGEAIANATDGDRLATVEGVRERVRRATVAFADAERAPEDWRVYVPAKGVALAVFEGTDPGFFNRLTALASRVTESLEKHPDLTEAWAKWLNENAGGDSWDIAKVQKKRLELEEIVYERENKDPTERQLVQVLLADPPWKYEFSETSSRQVENQYPTATVAEICDHIHEQWAPDLADDCVLLLWATMPKLKEALQVLEAWGFEYKTGFVWDKETMGMGYWARGQHELLLVGVRGDFKPPEPANRVSSDGSSPQRKARLTG